MFIIDLIEKILLEFLIQAIKNCHNNNNLFSLSCNQISIILLSIITIVKTYNFYKT